MITIYMASIDLIDPDVEPSSIWFIAAMEFLVEIFLISLAIGLL